MIIRVVTLLWIFCLQSLYGEVEKKFFNLTADPIDVVIVCHPKDTETLDNCIDGIKTNGTSVRRVIVVSSIKLTNKAEWFDEGKYPFNKMDVALAIGKGNFQVSEKFFNRTSRGAGWYFQQLLKLYAPFVIPDISSNVLVLDADTVFLNPVTFLNEKNGGMFCTSHVPVKAAYYEHAARLLPGYERIYPQFYSVCHHMLFQKPILKKLFKTIEKHHDKKFWVAFCHCVDTNGRKKGASEYEIYYNFALRNTDQVGIRQLHWANSAHLEDMSLYQLHGYQFVSFHTYMRGKWPSIFQNKSSLLVD